MMMLGIYSAIAISIAQGQNCAWEDFSLMGAQGYEIQCVEQSGQFAIGYTPWYAISCQP